MSIYSGFATRKQEDLYNSLMDTLTREIANKLLKSMLAHVELGEDMPFKRTLYNTIKKMQALEESKYLPPK
jgi:hypothetical protein